MAKTNHEVAFENASYARTGVAHVTRFLVGFSREASKDALNESVVVEVRTAAGEFDLNSWWTSEWVTLLNFAAVDVFNRTNLLKRNERVRVEKSQKFELEGICKVKLSGKKIHWNRLENQHTSSA